jgi:ectoine hydroxylase
MPSLLSSEQRQRFEQDGFVMVKGLFDREETAMLRAAIEQDPQLRASFYDRVDADGKSTRMATWNHPGKSVYGLAARCITTIPKYEKGWMSFVKPLQTRLSSPRNIES